MSGIEQFKHKDWEGKLTCAPCFVQLEVTLDKMQYCLLEFRRKSGEYGDDWLKGRREQCLRIWDLYIKD